MNKAKKLSLLLCSLILLINIAFAFDVGIVNYTLPGTATINNPTTLQFQVTNFSNDQNSFTYYLIQDGNIIDSNSYFLGANSTATIQRIIVFLIIFKKTKQLNSLKV